jgi:hypothetical protein
MTKPPAIPLVTGLEAIRHRLCVGNIGTVFAYARRPVDPLPLMMVNGVPTVRARYLDEWWGRTYGGGALRDGTPLATYEGLRAIADALGVWRQAVHKLAHRAYDPLPLRHTPAGKVWQYESAVRDWLDRQTMPYSVHAALTAARRMSRLKVKRRVKQ